MFSSQYKKNWPVSRDVTEIRVPKGPFHLDTIRTETERRRKQSCTTWFNPVSAYHLKPCFKSHRRSRLMISFWETQQATFWEAQQTYYMHCADVHCDWSLSEKDSHLDPPPRASSEFLCTCGPSSERLLPHVSTLADIMSRSNAS